MTDMKNYIGKLVAVRHYNDDDTEWKVSMSERHTSKRTL